MDLADIVSISGKAGLYQIIKPTRTGVIVESLDNEKKRLAATMSNKISVLDEISIYTTDAEGTVALAEVLISIYKEFKDDLGFDGKPDNDELLAFLKHVLPNFDEERVYPSDIKKLISWYNVLLRELPELLQEKKKEKPKAKKKAAKK